MPTIYPVQYYGMPNGDVCLIWTRPYTKPSGRTAYEIVVEKLENWSYDYEKENLYDLLKFKDDPVLTAIAIDRYNQKMTVKRVFKGFITPPTEHMYNGLIRYYQGELTKKQDAENLKFKEYLDKLERKEREEDEVEEGLRAKVLEKGSKNGPPKRKRMMPPKKTSQ